MISPVTGEVEFTDGLRFGPHVPLAAEHLRTVLSHHMLPIPGWTQHALGRHHASHGDFEVEAVSDAECRVLVVLFSHRHAFYEPDTPDDAERRAFHESVIREELHGREEFSWGEVFCHFDAARGCDWIVVAYEVGPQVPLSPAELRHVLYEHAPALDTRSLAD